MTRHHEHPEANSQVLTGSGAAKLKLSKSGMTIWREL